MLKTIARALGRKVLPFRTSESGVAALEAGLIFPFFFGIVGVILETGAIMYQEYAIQAGVQNAARFIRTGQAQQNGMNLASFKSQVCDFADVVPSCATRINVFVSAAANFTSITSPGVGGVGATADGTVAGTSYSCGGAGQAVAVIVTYDHEFITPFMTAYFGNIPGVSGRRRLAGYAMFRNEPFPTTTTCAAT
jgi:Flp pilus assembly protein TadG